VLADKQRRRESSPRFTLMAGLPVLGVLIDRRSDDG